MFRLNILAIFSLLGLIILKVSKTRSAKIKNSTSSRHRRDLGLRQV